MSDSLFEVVTDETILEDQPKYPPIVQLGPVLVMEHDKRCMSRGCGSPTNYKLHGIYSCSVHMIRRVNELLLELGVER